jgi:hypothetical protein
MGDIVAAATGDGWPGHPVCQASGMRRALPWVTVGLLVLGVGAGAGLGVARRTSKPSVLTATQQIAAIVAATRSAQTVRFTYASTTASTNRLLRRTDRGSGLVDFRQDTMRTAERDRSTGLSGTSAATAKDVAQDTMIDNVWIGRTEYIRFEPGADAGLDSPWLKNATWPKDAFGPLGELGQIEPLDELALDESIPGFRLESVGNGLVHGVTAHEYRIVVPLCGAAAPTDGISESTGPLQLWVDGQDRLLQARVSSTEDITKQANLGSQFPGARALTGRSTVISTVDLTDFGVPIAVAAPRVLEAHSSEGFSSIALKRGHCR